MKFGLAVFLVLSAFALLASAENGPQMKCVVKVPREYRKTPFNPPPSGQPEPVRYTNADGQIRRLQRKYAASAVQQYLKTIASQPEAKQKMRPYFDKPTPFAAGI